MAGFVKVPNNIFEYALTPSELMAYCFFSSKSNILSAVTMKLSTIAEGMGCSRNTAMAAVNGLVAKGLLSYQTRYHKGFQAANRYYITTVPGKWFKLDKAILALKLNKSDFSVYLYILRCSNKSGSAFPSAAKISSFTSISEPRVRQAIKKLSKLSLLRKRQQLKVCGSFGCNMFSVFTQAVRQSLLALYRKVKRQPLMFTIRAAFVSWAMLRTVCNFAIAKIFMMLCRWPGRRFYMRI